VFDVSRLIRECGAAGRRAIPTPGVIIRLVPRTQGAASFEYGNLYTVPGILRPPWSRGTPTCPPPPQKWPPSLQSPSQGNGLHRAGVGRKSPLAPCAATGREPSRRLGCINYSSNRKQCTVPGFGVQLIGSTDPMLIVHCPRISNRCRDTSDGGRMGALSPCFSSRALAAL
jgi:hypothetical protein